MRFSKFFRPKKSELTTFLLQTVFDLNGKDLMGERVHVEFAREQRGPRGGRFGGSRFGGSRYDSRRSSYRSGGQQNAEK